MFIQVIQENELTAQGDNPEEEEDEDQKEDDDEEDGNDMRLNVHEGFINNKKAALTAIGAMAEYTKESFAPYLQSSMEALVTDPMGALFSFHDIIRAEALECLPQLVIVACHGTGITNSPKKLQQIVLPAVTAEVVRTSMQFFLSAMQEDEAKSPVATALESASSVIGRVGVSCLSLQLSPDEPTLVIEALMEKILLIMNEKAPCQKSSDADDEDEDGDHDNIVMDSASDLIGTIAKTIGDQMIPFFDQLQKPLLKFMKPKRPFSDR